MLKTAYIEEVWSERVLSCLSFQLLLYALHIFYSYVFLVRNHIEVRPFIFVVLSLHAQLKLFKLFNVDTKGDFCKNITDIDDVFLAFLT